MTGPGRAKSIQRGARPLARAGVARHHRSMRPSDALRHRTVAALGRDYAVGRMGSDTFEARLDRAFAARSSSDLRRLRADTSPLPAAFAELRRRWRAFVAPRGPAAVDVRLPAPDSDRPLLIGRGRACDLLLRDETVSRRHAELVREEGRWMLRDLGSTNGTWDGAWRVDATEVDGGSELRFGELLVRFRH
jgi:hypothetical protein